jgi:hypothetical protein
MSKRVIISKEEKETVAFLLRQIKINSFLDVNQEQALYNLYLESDPDTRLDTLKKVYNASKAKDLAYVDGLKNVLDK